MLPNRFKGTVSKLLRKHFADAKPEHIVRRFARQMYLDYAPTKRPPFSPVTYAACSGIKIEYADLSSAEGLSYIGDVGLRTNALDAISKDQVEALYIGSKYGKGRIVLDNGRFTRWSDRRRRFTLAHEIGHFVIRENLKQCDPRIRLGLGESDEELLCNIFAAELLMPTVHIARDLCQKLLLRGLDPTAVITLCSDYEVSLQALLCRITKLLRGHLVAVICGDPLNELPVEWASPYAFRRVVFSRFDESTVFRAFEGPGIHHGTNQLLLDGEALSLLGASVKLERSHKVVTLMCASIEALIKAARAADPHPSI